LFLNLKAYKHIQTISFLTLEHGNVSITVIKMLVQNLYLFIVTTGITQTYTLI